MRNLAFFTICLFSILLTKAQTVHFDYDRSVDFSQYKTFIFMGWQNDSDKLVNDLDRKRLRDAFRREFARRKIRQNAADPDMAIQLFLVIDQKTSTTAYGSYMGVGGFSAGGWGWGAGPSTTTFTQDDYLVGVLVMDVYDIESMKLIWQGVVAGTIDDDPQKRDKSIPRAIAKLMEVFPVQGE